jgi:DNA invertase Pin-like site-specific DNA recombinase
VNEQTRVKALRLRVASRLARKAQKVAEQRDEAIRSASEAGGSLREIADATGTSHMTVKRIIERTD